MRSQNLVQQKLSEYLFSYGTLQDESIQFSTFGRKLSGKADQLPGYRLGRVPINKSLLDPTSDKYHLNAEFTGSASNYIAGTVFQVSMNEIEQADEYEATANYKRIRVELKSGQEAWVYVADES